jgi:hypothetical protein
MDDLKNELIKGQRLAVDETVSSWSGLVRPAMPPRPPRHQRAPQTVPR